MARCSKSLQRIHISCCRQLNGWRSGPISAAGNQEPSSCCTALNLNPPCRAWEWEEGGAWAGRGIGEWEWAVWVVWTVAWAAGVGWGRWEGGGAQLWRKGKLFRLPHFVSRKKP